MLDKRIFYNIQIILIIFIAPLLAQSTISTTWGPPENANEWQKFSIPLTAEQFGTDNTTFLEVMSNVQRIRIRTESSGSADIGALDNVQIGSRFSSQFNSGLDGWGNHGDGTLKWHADEGVGNSGHIAIHDWAHGDWTFAVTPSSWNGNWTALIGSQFEFYYKSTHPDGAMDLEISSIFEKRIQLSATPLQTPQNTTSRVTVTINETAASDIIVNLSSQHACFEVPRSVTITAGSTTAQFDANVPSDAETGCSSAIEATADDFVAARLILTVGERAGGETGGTAQLCGRVTDATTGVGIENATVTVGGQSTITDADGDYCIENIATNILTANFDGNPRSGNAPLTVQFNDQSGTGAPIITATAENYSTFRSSVQLSADEEKTLDISLSPVITDADMRIVLNWGEMPADMDLHLLVPASGDYNADHVYYSDKGDSTSYPFAYLDHDDRYSYGPETITIKKLHRGMYTFYVHKYSSSGLLTTSESVIQIYDRTGLVNTVNVPTSGDGDYWVVGQINGDTGQVLINNIIQSNDPSSSTTLGKTLAKETISDQADIISHEWDFDNDGIIDSRESNPQWTYSMPGDYTVSLRVSDGASTYTETKTNYISVTGSSSTSSGDYNVSITSIDATNFPAIKIFVSVIDTLTGLPLTELPASAFEILESGYTVSDIQVQKLGTTSGAKADIVFVFDTTFSMDNEMYALKNRCLAFADSIRARGIDYRLGLVTFADEVTAIHDFTSDAREFKTWIEGLRASGGDDAKENALEGLEAATTLSYREVTQKIVVLITDEDYHEQGESGDGQTDQTTESIISLYNAHDIMCNVVGPDLSQHKQIAKQTGGWFYHINEDFSDIIDRLGGQIMNQFVITFVPSNTTAGSETRVMDVTVTHNGKTGSIQKHYDVLTTRLVTFPQTIMGVVDQEYTLDVYVQNVTNLNFAKYFVAFDKTKIAITGVSSGEFLTREGATETFIYDIDETLGKIEFNQSRLVQGTSTSYVNGSGKLASITFKVIDSNCNSIISFLDVDLRQPSGEAITLYTGETQLYAASNIDGTSSILCDFDNDLDIDTQDFALLGTYWKPANNYRGDVGPASGAVPLLTAAPDGKVNFEDLFTFTRMWNWYYLSLAEGGSGLSKSNGELSMQVTETENLQVDVTMENIADLTMGRFELLYDKDAYTAVQIRPGNLLASDDAMYAFMADKNTSGLIDIAFAKMAKLNSRADMPANGILAHITFKKRSSQNDISLQFGALDFRSSSNTSIFVTATDHAEQSQTIVPTVFELSSYPNPFNPTATVEFSLPHDSHVYAAIYDVTGRMVHELTLKEYKAGVHKLTWNALNSQTASGIYFCRIQYGQETKSVKMLLVR